MSFRGVYMQILLPLHRCKLVLSPFLIVSKLYAKLVEWSPIDDSWPRVEVSPDKTLNP